MFMFFSLISGNKKNRSIEEGGVERKWKSGGCGDISRCLSSV